VTENCPNCGHASGYWRSTSQDWRCRRCGYIWSSAGANGAEDAETSGASAGWTDAEAAGWTGGETAEEEAEQERALETMSTFATPSAVSVSAHENYGFLANDVERILRDRAASLAEEVNEVSEVRTSLLVLFAIGDEWYGIDVRGVREIRREFSITPVPGVPPYIAGVINLRGEIVSVTYLAKLLGLEDPSVPATMIVCDLDGISTALLVGELSDIVEVAQSSIEPPLATLERTKAEHVTGQVAVDDRLVTILELEGAITPVG
jgi:purine-binding chemotaxis protein CheW